MDRLTRIGMLQAIFDICGGEIDSLDRLGKLMYLTQKLGVDLGQEFNFVSRYEIYPRELFGDIRIAKDWNIISSSEHGVLTLQLKDDCDASKIDPDKQEIIKRLNQKSIQTLDVLSVIVHLDENGYPLEKFKELKGNLEYYFPEAQLLALQIYGIGKKNIDEYPIGYTVKSDDYYRKGNLKNILEIMTNRFDDMSPEECKILSECFDILSQSKITLKDSVNAERMCGKFGVLLPF